MVTCLGIVVVCCVWEAWLRWTPVQVLQSGFVVLGGLGEDQHVLRYCGHVVLCLHSKKGERDCDKFVQPLFLVGVRIKSYSNLWLVTLHSCFQPASLTPHTAPLYLYTKLCAEKSHPLLWLNFPETSHDSLKNSIYQSLGLTFCSLASYIPVVFFGTHTLTLLDYHQALKLLNHVTCYTLCADWFALLCLPFMMHLPTKCLLLMVSLPTFIPACLISCLTSEFHLFHVCTGGS